MSAPPTSTPTPTTEFAPLRSSSSSDTAGASSPTEPRQPRPSSAPWHSVANRQSIGACGGKRHYTFSLVFSLWCKLGKCVWIWTRHTCRRLSGGQRASRKVALTSAGFTVGSSVSDSGNLAAPQRPTASFSSSIVPYRTKNYVSSPSPGPIRTYKNN